MALVANARMYSPTGAAATAWRSLFGEVAARSGVALEVIEHAYPAPLDALWSRGDLGAAFMCGFPFALAERKPQIVAAPLRQGRPHYCTELVVREDAPFAKLEETFGKRIGWTVENSQSGWNAIRHLFPSYRELVGPLVTPRRVIEALLDDCIDVGPLDSYVLDLLRLHEPALTERLRSVARTAPTPIPPLVASPDVPADIVTRLRDSFLELGPRPELSIEGFVVPAARDYARYAA